MPSSIVIMPGDGVGPEVISAAITVLKAVGETLGHRFELGYAAIGAAAYARQGEALPTRTVEMCKNCDAVLLGRWGIQSGKFRA